VARYAWQEAQMADAVLALINGSEESAPAPAAEPLTPERILASLEAKRDSYAEMSSGRLMMNGVVAHVRDLIAGCTCKSGMIGHWGCKVDGHDASWEE
jgi:hypothetical protein